MAGKTSRKRSVKLYGKRIILRPPTLADFDEYARLLKVSRPLFRGFIGRMWNRKQFKEHLRRCQRDDHYGFFICRREDDAILGSIGLFQIVRLKVQSAFTGYVIGAPYARQGYATEALQLVLRFAFKKMKLHRVEASIQPHNVPSRALVKRAGFTCEGLSRRLVKIGGKWRDHERWAVLVEDWRPLRR
jgi:ribosomal-protein-alanine N-acetyltransferase